MAKENFEELWIYPYGYSFQLREAVLMLSDIGLKPYIYNTQLCILPDGTHRYAQQSIVDWKDIYIPECGGCILKGQCVEFLESNKQAHSSHIKK